ncbi:MAG TPA: isoprenylcysteine carboxylmethyltransferase family protein [Flavisolibacter sp.]|jgi:protein-S-isoprenylcysteine O-methyltransferase Ste14|nr:isoprenylcysteine carboxylmethyltransferase family protein [Flavisolibacter sp.]
MNTKNHPGIYIPPPLIYVAFFLLSLLIQKLWPLNNELLRVTTAKTIGALMIVLYLLFFIAAIRRFILSKNTLVTIKRAHSLETSGIYAFTRNPMYLSLVCLYAGLAILFGNWWTFIFLPLLIMVVQLYVIKKEEQYLQQAFGSSYYEYKKKVRRWI